METNETLSQMFEEFNRDEEEFIRYVFKLIQEDFINNDDLTYKALRKIDEIKGWYYDIKKNWNE